MIVMDERTLECLSDLKILRYDCKIWLDRLDFRCHS